MKTCEECGEEHPLDENGLCVHCRWEWPEVGTLEEAAEYPN